MTMSSQLYAVNNHEAKIEKGGRGHLGKMASATLFERAVLQLTVRGGEGPQACEEQGW